MSLKLIFSTFASLLLAVAIFSARAQEKYAGEENLFPWELKTIAKGMNKTSSFGSARPCPDIREVKRKCSQLADQFCDRLWSPKFKGNVDFPSGKFRHGKSEKSELDQTKKIDLEALVDSEPRLPADLRTKAGPVLLKLKGLMKEERDSEDWYDAVDQTVSEFWDISKSIARQRVYQKKPELKESKKTDLNVEQRALFEAAIWDMKNEVIAAKYENHPNWLRVVRMFNQAKQDLLDEIPTWDISPTVKKRFLSKIREVQLKLPSMDPRLLGIDAAMANCSTTQVNAEYVDEHRTFTVCAGQFNVDQNDASIYTLISHEIGHAIDSDTLASDQFMDSPSGKVVNQLCNATGAVFPCSEWDSLKKDVLTEPKEIPEPITPLRKLTSCLVSEEDLKPFNDGPIRSAAKSVVANEMDEIATKNDFTDLAQEKYEKNGEARPYQYYLRPDRLRAVRSNLLFAQRQCTADTPIYLELLTQELSCNGYRFSASDRSEKFKSALQTTQAIGVALKEKIYSFCGRDCKELTYSGLSRQTYEETADWVSRKLMTRFLKRETSLEKRRETLFTGYADHCDGGSSYRSSRDLIEVEKSWSSEEHPSNYNRLMSTFSPEISKLVDCQSDEATEESSAKCEL